MTGARPSGPRLFVLDNYDSFTWNLVHGFEELGARVEVRRNDELRVEQVLAGEPDGIVVSPGPGRPADAGISLELIRAATGVVPLLGVCLGHQAIAESFGGRVVRAPRPMHGRTSSIEHDRRGLFADLPERFRATRYNSLTVDPESIRRPLRITARADDGTVMGLEHLDAPVFGVQFHPEAILTPLGGRLLAGFATIVRERPGPVCHVPPMMVRRSRLTISEVQR